MSHQIWHAFYYDRSGDSALPCRSEVIEAASEEAAARVARAASWRVQPGEPRSGAVDAPHEPRHLRRRDGATARVSPLIGARRA